ncbi:glycosyltransferase family 4 protein [Magnetococcales bacterium HHB-1]
MNHIILTGSDIHSLRGGISFALLGYTNALKERQVSYQLIPTYNPIAFAGRWWWWLRGLPKIIHASYRARRLGKKTIIYSHAGARLSLFREGIVLLVGRLTGSRTVIQIHAFEVSRYLKSFWSRQLFKLAISSAHGVAVLTPWWKTQFLDAGIKKALFIIPNPLLSSWEKIARQPYRHSITESRADDHALTIMTMTRLEAGKGVGMLIEAMAILPQSISLLIAGDGHLLPKLKQRVKQLSLSDRVLFKGWVEGEEKHEVFSKADLFCLPTRYDSFGMGFLEAMAYGLPIVALNHGTTPDVVPHNRAGLLINQEDPHHLAEVILSLQDQKQRQKMGNAGKAWILEMYAREKVGDQLVRMFNKLTDCDI